MANTIKTTTTAPLLFLLLLAMGSMGWAQSKATYSIGTLVDADTQDSRELMLRLQNEVRAVVGEDAIILFPDELQLSHDFDMATARENYDRLVSGRADLIIVLGSLGNRVVQQQDTHAKPTILFGSVHSDFSSLLLERETSGVENLTYLMGVTSIERDLNTLKELSDFNKVGIAVQQGVARGLPMEETLGPVMAKIGAAYTLLPYTEVKDIAENLQGLDAVYLASGFFLTDEEVALLGQVFSEAGLASFTASGPKDVDLGIMATNKSSEDMEQLLRRIALTIEAFVNGAHLSEQKVFVDFTERLTINFNTMQKLGLPIRYSLIEKTDFLGEIHNQLSEKTYTLLDIINDNLERNLFLRAEEKEVALTEQDIKVARSTYYPNLTANANFRNVDERIATAPLAPEFATNGNVQLSQTLFSEAANANINISKNLQKAQVATYNAAQLDGVLEASNLYFNALLSKVNLKIQNQNLQLTKENLRLAQQNFEAGQAGKSDMLRFQSQVAQNTQTMIEAVNQLDQAFISINQLLNRPVDTEIDIADAQLGAGVFERYNYGQLADLLDNPLLKAPFVDFLIEEAKKNSPELEALDYSLKAVKRTINLNAYGRLLPTVALQGAFNQNFNQWGTGSMDPNPANNYNVGVNISLPILNRFRNNIDKETALIQQEQLQLNRENIELALTASVSASVLNVINQISNIRLSEVSVKAAKESLELVQASYSEGAVSIIQLIDAQNNYLQAQLAQAGATYNFFLNTIQLERFMGYNFLLRTQEENDAFARRFTEFLDQNYEEQD
ncbi:TolC family protein [Maribacter sp. 2307ULW6-5]|uniref:TolC family protein n=1 Tax=Maribacter sp. 2307ULW6-5 TaxID=3386275 RepID=UPI0039BD3F03